MNEIRAAGLPYDLDTQLYVYLNDFIRNMDSIVTTTDSMNEDAKFFFEHAAKILRARKTYDAAWTHVVNQLKVFSEKMNMQLYGNSGGWRHIWDVRWHVYYVIGFDQTLNENPSIRIYIEVFKDGIARKEELRQILKEAGIYDHLQDDHLSSKSWAHLAYKDYKLSKKELEHLGATLYEKVTHDFAKGFELVKETLHK